MPLNKEQSQAVHLNKGPAMILAGPGSGKTTVITERIRCLIEEYGAEPSGILVITFTKAAAMEMQERFLKGQKQKAAVNFGTFHAVFFKILKYAYGFTAQNIIHPEKQWDWLREILYANTADVEDETDFVEGLLREISLVKGNQVDVDHYYSSSCPEELFRKIYTEYNGRLRRERLLDFDDMLQLCYELFRERPDILAIWQAKYRYILIDEFQDINILQYKIVQMLAKPENNLFIVGDDDQSIYRFRGARPEIMLGFPKDYPGTKIINLKTCYRCSASIVAAASHLILHNKTRFPKKLESYQKDQGVRPLIRGFEDIKQQNRKILEDICFYRNHNIPFSEMALLYRSSFQAQSMVGELIKMGIPFVMKDRIPNIFEHWMTRDILTYLRIAAGSKDRRDYLRIINRPKRYISRGAFTEPQVDLEKVRSLYTDKDWIQERLDRLEYDLRVIGQMKPYAAVNYIRKAMNYDLYVQEFAGYRNTGAEDLIELLDQIQESAAGFESVRDWVDHMKEYTQKLSEQTRAQKEDREGVQISTMHGAKGLEYKVVFIPDANEEILPHRKAVLPEDIEEERRLFYVALTRAKTYLHIYWTDKRRGHKVMPSRFLEECRL